MPPKPDSEHKLPRVKEEQGDDISRRSIVRKVVVYVRVLKPRETILLTLIGICSAILASAGNPDLARLSLVAIAILIGSGGANGLTNYLDRRVDSKMTRTRARVLPAGLLQPRSALIWSTSLVCISLLIVWTLHPLAFLFGFIATLSALIARKTWATHFLGAISGCGPVLVGWLSINPQWDPTLLALSGIILLWTPVHVWNLMLAYRTDYLRAGVNIFPLTQGLGLTSWLSLSLTVLLVIDSVVLWHLGGYGALYLLVALAAGAWMLRHSVAVVRQGSGHAAYRNFKLSAYPFLGLTFLALVIDSL